MSIIAKMRKLAESQGLTVKDCGKGHIQITGGPMLVNYWPDSRKRTCYVGSTREGRNNVTPEKAVEWAKVAPVVVTVPTPRKDSYRKAKVKMIRRQKTCRWCGCQLSLDGNLCGTMKATLEHIIPLKRGGLDNANNWTLACEACNTKRGHDMPEIQEGSAAMKHFESDQEFELSNLLTEQKRLTERWYLRMSGAAPWKPGQRELMDQKFEAQNVTIRGLQEAI
jgi:5-methylcytosine-specific restriction endonuclease McrA